MDCKEIMKVLERLAPTKYALEWDNVGLLVGREDKEVRKIMIALDASQSVIDQCVNQKVDLLITHHPLIFSPLKRINGNDFVGRKVMELLQNDISYYAIHTNFDSMVMAKEAADKIMLVNLKVLDTTYMESLYKVVVFVPTERADFVRQAMVKEDAGHIGAYSHCTFNMKGVGTFRPLEGTHPYIGTKDEVSYANEVRIETIVGEEKLQKVIQSMLRAHPYEEVAYDIYKLERQGKSEGIGRYGYLERNMPLEELANLVKTRFELDYVKVMGRLDKLVSQVAISPGSGKSMIAHALKVGADVLITGDIDHHAALDAMDQGLAIIDAGHFGTEYFMVDYLKKYLNQYLYHGDFQYVGIPIGIEILKAKEETPFKVL